MKDARDVVVIGAGVNGLTTACLLAKAGRRVTLFEARDRIGGLAAKDTFFRGFTSPGVLQDTAGFREEVDRELDLGRYGLRRRERPVAIWGPASEGTGVWVRGDTVMGDVSPTDPTRFKDLMGFVRRVRPALANLLNRPAPDPLGPLPPLVGAAWSIRRLGTADLTALTRVAPMSSGDWLRDTLYSERLRALVALPGLTGSYMGPWSGGSAGNLLLKMLQQGREVIGGPAAVVEALKSAAEALGVEVRTLTPVKGITVRSGRAIGVVLKGDDEISAQTVVASCDPRQTFLDLVGAQWLSAGFAQDVRNWRCRGITASVQLALSGPLTTPEGEPVEAVAFGESLDMLERSFDAAKHRRPFHEPPAMQLRQPTVETPSLAPSASEHVATVLVHGVPYDVEGGWTDALKSELGDAVISAIARHCPDAESLVLGSQVLTPRDLGRRYRITGGHLMHGEHAPDQLLFLRPNLSCSHHATPIADLWLCGSGSHPGGGITGAPGLLAARAILQ